MNRLSFTSFVAAAVAALAVAATSGKAEQPADIDAILVVNTAFYAALSAKNAKAMEAVWADKPYVTNIGPSSKAAAVGFVDAVSGYWPKTFARFTELKASATSAPQVQANGTLAWVIGREGVTGVMTSGKVVKYDALYTNIFEKVGGRWLMVSHHAHRLPQ